MNQYTNGPTKVMELWEKGILARGELPLRLIPTLTPETTEEFARAVTPDVLGIILDALRNAPITDTDWGRMRVIAAGAWAGPWTEEMAERQRQSEREEIRRYRAGVELLRSYHRCLFASRDTKTAAQWFTSPVLDLARTMYDSRDFSPMPILADALQEAGCENEDVLNHCRSEEPHVRGCWVVDLLTGRK